MRKFNITVNGTSYEVEVEEIGGTQASAPVQAAPVAPKAAPAPKAVAPKVTNVKGTKVSSPMPGTVLSLKVKNGDAVKKGQPLLILEAMKMENEIAATCDGTVSVVVAVGAKVETGDVLASID